MAAETVPALFSLNDDLLEAVVCSMWSPRELSRLAASHRRFRLVVRRLLRDRSHPIWRQFCVNEGGGAVFVDVTDFSSLYFKLRKITPPRMDFNTLQFIVKVHLLIADATGGESNELVFSEHLHGRDAMPAFPDAVSDDPADAFGFKWPCRGAARLPEGLRPHPRFSSTANAVDRFQEDCINGEHAFPPAHRRAQWTPQYIARRAGQRTWRLSLTCFHTASQTLYRLLDDAPPRPDFSDMGGPGGWSAQFFAFQHQPLHWVTSSNTHPPPDWRAHAMLVPPEAGSAEGAPWEFHFNMTEDETGEEDWEKKKVRDLVAAMEELKWA